MKNFTQYIWFNTTQEEDWINVTSDLQSLLKESKVSEGFMLVSSLHLTSSVAILENQPEILQEIRTWLEKSVFELDKDSKKLQPKCKGLLLNSQVLLPITKQQLELGRWQQVFYVDFDGKRKKRILVKIFGE